MEYERFMYSIPPVHGELKQHDCFGNIIIRSLVRKSSGTRLHFEKRLLPRIAVGLPDWERAHSQGHGTGHESMFGITYAPYEVNQVVQRLGVERRIIELESIREKVDKVNDILIILTTETGSYSIKLPQRNVDIRCLREITYVLQVYHKKYRKFRTAFEVTVSVEKPCFILDAEGKEVVEKPPKVSLSGIPQLSHLL